MRKYHQRMVYLRNSYIQRREMNIFGGGVGKHLITKIIWAPNYHVVFIEGGQHS